MCFSPRHDFTVPRMSLPELRVVVNAWVEQYVALGKTPWINHVEIFENRGEMMGASNPHPHCQIWANASLPNLPARELASFREYQEQKHSCLLCDYLKLELQLNLRVVCQNEAFAVVVPFLGGVAIRIAGVEQAPYSLRSISLASRSAISSATSCAASRFVTTICSRRRSRTPWDFHQKPTDGSAHEEWHLHAHYFPPLLRSATIQKFMVGYELLGSPQRDVTPESAANRLRETGHIHYLDRS